MQVGATWKEAERKQGTLGWPASQLGEPGSATEWAAGCIDCCAPRTQPNSLHVVVGSLGVVHAQLHLHETQQEGRGQGQAARCQAPVPGGATAGNSPAGEQRHSQRGRQESGPAASMRWFWQCVVHTPAPPPKVHMQALPASQEGKRTRSPGLTGPVLPFPTLCPFTNVPLVLRSFTSQLPCTADKE